MTRQPSNLAIATCSHPGKVRSHNEDAVFADAGAGLVVLADGMGGYNAGEVASGMATNWLGTELVAALAPGAGAKQVTDQVADTATSKEPASDPNGNNARTNGRNPQRMRELLLFEVNRANEVVFQTAQSQPQYAGMGTTLVMAVFHHDMATVAHIGDSRLYRFRAGSLEQLTRDHSLLQDQIDSGLITREQARYSHNKNLVTRALGIDPVVDVEIADYPTLAGDVYLLCSDGLNDMVEDLEIAATLLAMSSNLEACARQLVDLANHYGGRDNVSVILVKVMRSTQLSRPWWAWLRDWFK